MRPCNTITTIKLTGIFLLLSGWVIILAALALLQRASQVEFALAGGAVEAVGAALLFRAHRMTIGDRR